MKLRNNIDFSSSHLFRILAQKQKYPLVSVTISRLSFYHTIFNER